MSILARTRSRRIDLRTKQNREVRKRRKRGAGKGRAVLSQKLQLISHADDTSHKSCMWKNSLQRDYLQIIYRNICGGRRRIREGERNIVIPRRFIDPNINN